MLSHLRVLDLTDGGASIASRILGDLGAEVILVEPPSGVASRRIGPFAGDIEGPERRLEFWANHRGKRSARVDLETETGRERLRGLAKSADRRCPTLGQHNHEILSELLELSDDAITDLVIAGAIE